MHCPYCIPRSALRKQSDCYQRQDCSGFGSGYLFRWACMGLLRWTSNIEFPMTYNLVQTCTKCLRIPSKQRVASSSLAGRATPPQTAQRSQNVLGRRSGVLQPACLGWSGLRHKQRRKQNQNCSRAGNPKGCTEAVTVCDGACQCGSHGADDNFSDNRRLQNRRHAPALADREAAEDYAEALR